MLSKIKQAGTAVDFSKRYSFLQWVTAITMVLFFISNVYWMQILKRDLTEAMQSVFVVDDNGTVVAVKAPTATPSVYEARNQVKQFMKLMFSHDADTYKDRIDMAFKLINRQDGLAIFQTFREGKVLENYNRYNIHTELQIDSVNVDVATEPYVGTVFTQQKVIYPDEIQYVPIAARFHLVKTYRSEDNPFGLQIKDFNFIEYEPKKEQ